MIEALYDDEAFEPFTGPSVEDEMTARVLLQEYHRNERRIQKLKETAAQVTLVYQTKADAIQARQESVREMLRLYCLDHGAVSFPDVGAAHVTQRKPTPKIADPAALLAWAHVHAPTLIEVSERVPAKAVSELVKADGVLPDGVEVVHPEPSVTIKARQ